MSTELATRESANGALANRSAMLDTAVGTAGIQIANGSQMWALAQGIAKSGLAPKGIERPESIFIALQMGMELGLPPMAALQNIAIINGRPSLWGDAQLAVCRATGELKAFDEWYEQGGKRLQRNPVTYTDDTVAVCRVVRANHEPMEVGFSVADAKRASLWGKSGPWTQYPFRMLRSRARSYALRDTFGDALRGLMSSDEVIDIPPVQPQGARPVSEGTKALAALLNNPQAVPANVDEQTGEEIEPAKEMPAEDAALTGNAAEADHPEANPAAAPEPQAAQPDAAQADADEPPADYIPDELIGTLATWRGAMKQHAEAVDMADSDFLALMKAVTVLHKVNDNRATTAMAARREVLAAFRAGTLGMDGKIQQ